MKTVYKVVRVDNSTPVSIWAMGPFYTKYRPNKWTKPKYKECLLTAFSSLRAAKRWARNIQNRFYYIEIWEALVPDYKQPHMKYWKTYKLNFLNVSNIKNWWKGMDSVTYDEKVPRGTVVCEQMKLTNRVFSVYG